MHAVIPLNKPAGKTPLWCLQRLKDIKPELAKEKMSYAGRLDPLARGVLLALIGNACKEKDAYLNLDKSYAFSIVLGLQTDSYDSLGLLTKTTEIAPNDVKLIVNSFVNASVGNVTLPYPPYSSKTVGGKPLFWWARENKLSKIALPLRNVTITSFMCDTEEQISLAELNKTVSAQIMSVQGDFRQKQIQSKWDSYFATCPRDKEFTKLDFTLACSSGTYVRSLSHLLGEKLGCGAITLDILRTRVGDFILEHSLELVSPDH